jgi:aerobic carbon-monoxide dehydrogenase medium subunit
MYPASFDYYRPKNLKEAVALLRKTRDAKLLAGGHSLLPAMRLRVSAPGALIDIGRIKGLQGIKVGKSSIKMGALTTHAEVAGSKEIRKACAILSEAAGLIGDIQVRNRGTVGGSLAHADPAADYPTVMVALEADIVATGPKGSRKIPARKFFVDLFETALKGSEILSEVSVPVMRKGEGGCYLKHRHPASSYAVVGVAALVSLKNDAVKRARVVVGGVTETPLVVESIDAALAGAKPSAKALADAATLVAEAIESPLGDLYASGEYRTHLATVLARRALTEAVARAKKQK